MRQGTHCLTKCSSTLVVPVKETKGHFFVKSLFPPFSNGVQIFSITHDLFYGHEWSTRKRRVRTTSRRKVFCIRWRKRGSDRRRNQNRFWSCRRQRHRTKGLNFLLGV